MSSAQEGDSSSSSLYDISGFVFGLFGIAGTFQIICVIVFYYFPKRRLHGLEATYAEAYSLYHCGLEEGVLESDKQRIEEKLRRYIYFPLMYCPQLNATCTEPEERSTKSTPKYSVLVVSGSRSLPCLADCLRSSGNWIQR